MSRWFDRAFATAGQAVAEARHEILGGWFGRNFEPHPIYHQPHEQPKEVAERDIHGNEHGIDR